MQTWLRLFLDWGISFGEPYLLPERAARAGAYASKQELDQAIFRCQHGQQIESDAPPATPAPPSAVENANHQRWCVLRSGQTHQAGAASPVVVRTDTSQE